MLQEPRQQGLPMNGGPLSWESGLSDNADIVTLWFRITAGVANILFPIGELSMLYPNIVYNDFLSIRIAFYGICPRAELICSE